MSTASVTKCEGPGCSAEHHEGPHVLVRGWYSVSGNVPEDERGGDFCSAGCLAAAATAWATRRVEQLVEEATLEASRG